MKCERSETFVNRYLYCSAGSDQSDSEWSLSHTPCNSYNGVKFKFNKTYIESVGPIQKLSVPDFQHINSVFEQMQSEILEKPSKAR